jgi:tRNA (guanine26-N2/guanine27-N2)-dimethyltransferase
MTFDNLKPEFPTEIIQEGKTKVLVPKLKEFVRHPCEYAPSKAPVFYNPVMELNRDIAVSTVQAYQKMTGRKIAVCEPLTGCGLRGIRFAAEVKGVKKVVIGDINENAFRLASYNVQMNGLKNRVTVKKKEANYVLSSHSAPHKRFDVIDIDPFGSPVSFIDSAVRALRNHGLIALTATDMAALCGVHSKACIRRYGGKPLRTEYCHELAIRLLAGCIATIAAKHDVGTRMVFSHRGEHYVRVYATIDYGARNADESLSNMGYVLHCFKCFHRETVKGFLDLEYPRKCSECGSRLSVAGPLWLGNITDPDYCGLIQQQSETRKLRLAGRIGRMLTLIKTESNAPITYYVIDSICDMISRPVPSVKAVAEALRNAGFHAALTHFSSRGIRSEVPSNRLMSIIRELSGPKPRTE